MEILPDNRQRIWLMYNEGFTNGEYLEWDRTIQAMCRITMENEHVTNVAVLTPRIKF